MHQPGEPHVDVILDRIKQVIARDNRLGDGTRPGRSNLSPVLPAEPLTPPNSYALDDLPLEPVNADEAAEVLELEDEFGPQASEHHYGSAFDDAVEQPAIPPEAAGDYGQDEDLIAYDWSEPEGLGEAEVGVPQPASPAPADQPVADAVPLTSIQTREAMRENLAALSMLSTVARERQARGLDDTSIEALASDLLRPMLADWLDANLAPMVERLVQTEIRRIVGEGR